MTDETTKKKDTAASSAKSKSSTSRRSTSRTRSRAAKAKGATPATTSLAESASTSPIGDAHADTRELPKGVEPGDSTAVTALPGGITHETPAEADRSSEPTPNDAKPNDPPVRAAAPDIGIAQTLASGAGEHKVVEDEHLGTDGRWYQNPEEAAAQRRGETFDPEKSGS